MLLSSGLDALKEEVDNALPGCTFLGLATGLIPELKIRIEAEMDDKKYDNEPYWMKKNEIDKWRK